MNLLNLNIVSFIFLALSIIGIFATIRAPSNPYIKIATIVTILLAVIPFLVKIGYISEPPSSEPPPSEAPSSESPPSESPIPIYWEDLDNPKVTVVQISATNHLDGAEQRFTEMVNAGFDSFIYVKNGKYRVMCGKFRDFNEAENYRKQIIAQTPEDDAYLTNAYLTEDVIEQFEAWYYR